MNNPPSRTPRSLGTRRAGPAAQQQQGPRSAAGANAAMLRLALQRNMNWTAAWWNGHDRWWAEQDAAGLREPIYRLYDVPQRRPRIPSGSGPFFPPGFSDSSPPPPPVSIAQRRLRRFELLGSGVEAAQQSLVQLQAAVEAGRGNVGFLMDPVRPTGLRLRKILGKGGQGVVALFEVRDGNVARGSRRRRKVVIKGPIWNDASTRALLTKEKDNVLKLAGAKHIVQRQPIRNLVNTSPQPRVPPPGDRTGVPLALVPGGAQRLQREAAAAAAAEVEAARAFDELPYMYAMEFMKFGDAHSLLVKGATQGVKWKSEELWMVFECLLKGITAMTFPGIWAPPGSSRALGRSIPLQDEVAPPNVPIDPEQALVHFDLDPYNVMIGDYEPVARGHFHDKVPVFKIGGLGVATDIPARMKRSVHDTNVYRFRGKAPYFTPEQTTKEWNFVGPHTDMTQEPTAGRYGWESNVFQVGGLMACFITGEVSQYPPEARPFQLQGANGNTELAWTYGGRCMDDEFGDIDVNLRSLVAWCMVHRPSQRPHMYVLEDEIRRNLAQDWARVERNRSSKTPMASILIPPPPVNPAPTSRPLPAIPIASPPPYQAMPANWRPPPLNNNGNDNRRQPSPPPPVGPTWTPRNDFPRDANQWNANPQNNSNRQSARIPLKRARPARPLPPLPPGAGRGGPPGGGNVVGRGAGPAGSVDVPAASSRPFSWQRSPGATTVVGGRVNKRPPRGARGGRSVRFDLPDDDSRPRRSNGDDEAPGGTRNRLQRMVDRFRLQRLVDRFRQFRLW